MIGFLVIDKPCGLTSHDCVSRLRKIYGIKRIGHGGTLDPAVTGVLPIAIGKATRFLSFLPSTKKYEATIQLGLRTSTDDLEGEIIRKEKWPQLEKKSISHYLNEFKGNIKQRPPQFSSVHIKGERAYKKARRGETFDLPLKQITIHDIQLLQWNKFSGEINLNVSCSSGTYIRALARDIGERIGCGGSLAKLRRTESLGFNINQAIPLPTFEKCIKAGKPLLIKPLDVLTHLPKIKLSKEEQSLWRQGQSLTTRNDRLDLILKKIDNENDYEKKDILVLNYEGELIGLATWHPKLLKIQPKIVFNGIG